MTFTLDFQLHFWRNKSKKLKESWSKLKNLFVHCKHLQCQNCIFLQQYSILHWHSQEPLALDGAVVRKISKRHFLQDIKNSLHGVTRMGLKPHQIFFQKFFSTNMVARGVQSFCIHWPTDWPMTKIFMEIYPKHR